MKRFTILSLFTFLCFTGWAQHRVAPSSAKNAVSAKPSHFLEGNSSVYEQSMLDSKPGVMARTGISNSTAKTAAMVSPVQLGRASNAFTILRTSQNQVYANDSLGIVGFIHRQDITIHGGSATDNGIFRYDLSTDRGQTFTNDIGKIQVINTNYGRYPQFTGMNIAHSSNPFDAKFVYSGATNHFPSPGWIGHVYGVSDIVISAPTATENYLFDGRQTVIPGGLTQAAEGIFYNTEWAFDGTNYIDSLFIYKGTYNSTSTDVDWVRHITRVPPHYLGFDGTMVGFPPDMGASPNGSTVWLAWLGDLVGGHDSCINPVFMRSTDGGNTFGTAMEVDLRTFSWIADSLQSLWTDSLGNPVSAGRPTCTNGFDITVDANGNPHMITVVGSGQATGALPGYVIYPGLAKFMADITTTDGGTTWKVNYISPVLSYEGEFGAPDADGNLLTLNTNPQISRSQDGSHIFYSFVDADTTISGFGESTMSIPNLRIAGLRISDGFITCWKRITDGDIVWDGKIFAPSMAPVVLPSGPNFKLPIVFVNFLANDQSAPCNFQYLGNDAVIYDYEFHDRTSYDLSFMGQCYAVNTAKPLPVDPFAGLNTLFPNPAKDRATMRFNLVNEDVVNLSVSNLLGTQIWSATETRLEKGTHDIQIPLNGLSPGIYLVSIKAGSNVKTHKLVVE